VRGIPSKPEQAEDAREVTDRAAARVRVFKHPLRSTLLEFEDARVVADPVQEPLAPRCIWNLGRTRIDDPARLAEPHVRRLVVSGRVIRLGGPVVKPDGEHARPPERAQQLEMGAVDRSAIESSV
jgi:hypothetical protein